MEIPGLGTVTEDKSSGWHYSAPIAVPVLGGKVCRIVLEGYEGDTNQAEFHDAIANFLSIGPAVLQAATPHVFRYYEECREHFEDDDQFPDIASPEGVWAHVHLGDEPIVKRRHSADKGIYVSLECNCDWEIEHGLQIVFKNGLAVSKVGPYDGHLTHSDAYADESLEGVIYPVRQ